MLGPSQLLRPGALIWPASCQLFGGWGEGGRPNTPAGARRKAKCHQKSHWLGWVLSRAVWQNLQLSYSTLFLISFLEHAERCHLAAFQQLGFDEPPAPATAKSS